MTLVQQASVAPCVEGRSFGCEFLDGRPTVWARNCSGSFLCAGHNGSVDCGFPPAVHRTHVRALGVRPEHGAARAVVDMGKEVGLYSWRREAERMPKR